MSKSPFEIDRDRLDVECENQSLLCHQLNVLLADEEDRLATAKADMELTEAEVELAVRNEPEKFVPNPKVKITETLISATVKVSKRYQTALRAYNAAKHAVGIAKAGTEAIDHRKRMIEKLCELQGRDYFSGPRLPKGVQEGVIEISRKTVRVSMEEEPPLRKKKRRVE